MYRDTLLEKKSTELLQKKHANETALELYKMASGHKVYGYYFLGARLIGITDPELIRRVLVKDFDHFVDRQKNMFMEISTSKTDEVRKVHSVYSSANA